jgi:hypothetical protein
MCYPDPKTHPQVKNHVAFMKGVLVKLSTPPSSLPYPHNQ